MDLMAQMSLQRCCLQGFKGCSMPSKKSSKSRKNSSANIGIGSMQEVGLNFSILTMRGNPGRSFRR
jgi:hypothetical protein